MCGSLNLPTWPGRFCANPFSSATLAAALAALQSQFLPSLILWKKCWEIFSWADNENKAKEDSVFPGVLVALIWVRNVRG